MLRFLLVMACTFLGFVAQAQQPVELRGRVLDAADSMGAQFVHIYGIKSGLGGTSEVDGSFTIMVLPGDTLRFTSVGYITKQFFVPQDVASLGHPTILIYREVYNIDQVVVMPQVNMRKDPTTPPPPPTPTRQPVFGIGTGPGGGITFGFDNNAAHIRNQQDQIAQWEYQEMVKEYVAYRYNAEFIQQYVNLQDDEIAPFMNYCHLPDEFILRANDYDLAKAVKDCYASYRGNSR